MPSGVNCFLIPQFIPRTSRMDPNAKTLKQEDFIKLLVPKLEAIEKEQKRMEIFHKNFPKDEEIKMDKHKLFNDAISARLMADDTDNQDILDNHVSRVWNERTPHRSPGNLSPGTQFTRARRPHENMVAIGLSASKRFVNSLLYKFLKFSHTKAHNLRCARLSPCRNQI